jgi:competence CoiA-like predicted nuclease
MQLSLKNIPHNMHLYSTLFIDEIRVSQIFNRDSSRNQIGFNFGASITDFPIRYLTLSAEYTRVNPFVYQNLNPAQTYTNQGFYLGDWMGNNFDRLIFSLKYTPAARVKCLLRYQYIRKGLAGNVDQQYFQYPEPAFLTPLIYTQKQYYLNISYEWKHNIYMVGNFNRTETNNNSGAVQNSYNNYSVGLNFGL